VIKGGLHDGVLCRQYKDNGWIFPVSRWIPCHRRHGTDDWEVQGLPATEHRVCMKSAKLLSSTARSIMYPVQWL